MAKVIKSVPELQPVVADYSLLKMAIIGLVLGLMYFGAALLLGTFVSSAVVVGNISTVIIIIIGVAIMIRLRMVQPLLISVAVGLALWGILGWTSGLVWFEMLIWDVLLYGLAYVLFSWISRYEKVIAAMIVMLLIIIALRTILTF